MALTVEMKVKILLVARRKVEAGHMVGNCYANRAEGKPNPDEGFCLRGAIERAGIDCGLSQRVANNLSNDPSRLKMDLGGMLPCNFSDKRKKAGCLKAIDAALAKFPKAA